MPYGCNATIDLAVPPRPSNGATVGGVLSAMNNSQPAAALIAPLVLSMFRGPPNTWLWPNRTGCTYRRTCCTAGSCSPPFYLADRLARLGLRQQYILGSLHRAVTRCDARSMQGSPHNCSLPGGPADPDLTEWEYTVAAVAREAKRRGLAHMYFDVWNEPNSELRTGCLAHDRCPWDSNLTTAAFYRIHDAAHRTLRRELPTARLVAPSLGDGGPGIDGFRSVLPWLQVNKKPPDCIQAY